MKIKQGKQIEASELRNKLIDVFILAGNHEHRVFTAYNHLSKLCSINKVNIFCYNNNKIISDNSDFKVFVITDHEEIYSFLDSELENINKEEINIIIDYSCMTKPWYYSIILYFSNKQLNLKKANIYFVYTPSVYSKPLQPKPNYDIAPLPGKYVVPTDKPKALIVCLGYEQNKAEGIIDHLDPKVNYLFYTKPAIDPQFVSKLETNNLNLLKLNSNNIITYPYDDLLFLERELTLLYHFLKSEYSIIIAPLGPKPFAFISMILAAKYKDIDIWRVGSGSDINEYERAPYDVNKVIICNVTWESEILNIL